MGSLLPGSWDAESRGWLLVHHYGSLRTCPNLSLPFLVICDVMGVPEEQRDWLRRETATLGRAFANQRDHVFVEQGNAAVRALLDFFSALLHERAGGTGDDLLSVLGAEDLTADEDRADVVANCVFFIVAGHETTSTLIAAGADLLCHHPAQRAALAADPSRWPAAVEEMLRYVSPTTFTGARARVDVEVEGERFEAGSQRLMFYAAANHDPGGVSRSGPVRHHRLRQRPPGVLCGGTLLPWSSAGSYGSRDRPVHPVPPHPGTGHQPACLAWQRPTPADRVPAQPEVNRHARKGLTRNRTDMPR
jgi:hypothetical protein